MQNSIWGGRFIGEPSALLKEFNASIDFDKNLAGHDIKGSLAHCKMLAAQGLITQDEFALISDGLRQIQAEIERGEFSFCVEDEDIHMAIEKRLTALVGQAGKKLHTARSRNDQVAVDFKMFVLDSARGLRASVLDLVRVCVDMARANKTALMPGMTHLQHAQPISFAYHILAYAAMFERDARRLEDLIKRNNFSPLGCAALAGTPHNTDRFALAKDLGFDAPCVNCLDGVSDRDFALDLLYAISVFFMHASRLSEELILWNSSEFGFITIGDEFTTGSSIMPQKKNPDVAELIRGKTGRIYGNLVALLSVMKALPLAYNKDMQEDKEGVFDSVRQASASAVILAQMLKTVKLNRANMLSAAKKGHLTATDLADYLVKKGVAFRDAHFVSGKAVAKAEEMGVDLSDLGLPELKSLNEKIEDDVMNVIALAASKESRQTYGATSSAAIDKQLEYFESFLSANI